VTRLYTDDAELYDIVFDWRLERVARSRVPKSWGQTRAVRDLSGL